VLIPHLFSLLHWLGPPQQQCLQAIIRNILLFIFDFKTTLLFWFLVDIFFFLFIYSYVHMLFGHFSPLPPTPFSTPSLSPPPLLASRQNLFCPLLQLCWRQDISNNKKDIAFLPVWHQDSYTERFLALLLCTCVLQPRLIHLYETSSPLPGPLAQWPLSF
jgi:hypothetical protein